MDTISRIAAVAIWLAASCVTVVLLREFTATAGPIYFVLILVALAAACFGIVFCREAYAHGNYVSAAFCFVAWVTGVSLIGTFETGYFSAKSDLVGLLRNSEITSSQTAEELAERDRAKLKAYADTRPVREVQTDIAALLHKPVTAAGDTLERATKGCSASRIPPYLTGYCDQFRKLESELSRSQEAETVNQRTWDFATRTGIPVVRTLDLDAPAKALAQIFNLPVPQAKRTLIWVCVVLLFLCRDGMLFVALAPRRRRPQKPSLSLVTPESPKAVAPPKSTPPTEPRPVKLSPLPKTLPIEAPAMSATPRRPSGLNVVNMDRAAKPIKKKRYEDELNECIQQQFALALGSDGHILRDNVGEAINAVRLKWKKKAWNMREVAKAAGRGGLRSSGKKTDPFFHILTGAAQEVGSRRQPA